MVVLVFVCFCSVPSMHHYLTLSANLSPQPDSAAISGVRSVTEKPEVSLTFYQNQSYLIWLVKNMKLSWDQKWDYDIPNIWNS